MKLRYLLALSLSTSLFGAGAPSEKDKKTSELPFAGNAAAIPAAPEAPKLVPNDPIAQTQELECRWIGLWAKIEANVLAAMQQLPMTPEKELLHAAMTPDLQAKIKAAIKWKEDVVPVLLAKNPQRFEAYQELQKKGVQWPHSPELLRYWERNDFVFRPTRIQHDRVVCDTCKAEVSGIMPWMKPLDYHDFTKHRREYTAHDDQWLLEQAKIFPPMPDPARAALDANLRLITNYARGAYENDPVAKLFLRAIKEKMQMPGWRMVADYIDNPQRFTERTQSGVIQKK